MIQVHTNDVPESTHLKLQDIWEAYDEWSSCGVHVPVKLESGERIVQYLAPSLSAIQIFIKKSPSTSSEEDTTSVLTPRFGSSSDDDGSRKSNENDRENGVPSDHLYVQFIESCSPYSRMPFLDKVGEILLFYFI